jgi:hypothetical protein
MKRFLLLILSAWNQQLKLYAIAAFVGALSGIFVLAPSYDYITVRKQGEDPISSIEYVFNLVHGVLTGTSSDDDFLLIIYYAEIGAMLGVSFLILYKIIHKKVTQIDYLTTELDKDLPSIIRQGEGPYLEFKSSMRWDLVELRVNKALERVVLKTLTGFLNSSVGGTLLIGVADNGEILGLENDYQTLKKPGQDGFEQTVMTAISTNLGGDLCSFVHVLFHVLDNKDVCRLIVSPSIRPVFLTQSNTPKFYLRTGGATRDLNIQEALSYVSGRWE